MFPLLAPGRSAIPAAILSLLLIATAGADAAEYCQRQPFDAELPAGVTGEYQVIGQQPVTGAPYRATLTLQADRQGYRLIRDRAGQISQGEAWLARCGRDHIMMLLTREADSEGRCMLTGDEDNYYRVSCRTRQPAGQSTGLEAWFQTP